MLDFLKRIFNDNSSRKQANDRLRVVLTHDRTGASTRLMETLKEEILEVISRHVEIEGKPDVRIIREGRRSALDINIPLKGR
ncbi:MAG: cell division topological specificity factor MinE [Syntrophomonas sp.]